MTPAASETLGNTAEAEPGARAGLLERLAAPVRFLAGVLFCLTPPTAVLVLGWLMRLMQAEEALAREQGRGHTRRMRHARLPRWVMAETPASGRRLTRLFGGLAENARLGVASLITIAAGTLPFMLLWLFSWWGGWENSFNKGYEQAWVGPTIGLVGVALSLPLLARLPMALAHQAVEGRMAAFFAWRDVRCLIRAAGWRYVWLSLLCVLAAVPLFAAKGAPVFVEHWSPGFADRNPEAMQEFGASYRFWATAYLVTVLLLLRRSAAHLHARAALTLDERAISRGLLASVGAVVRTVLLWLIWFGLVAQVYVGQFLSHQWLSWLNHPLIGLPWLPPLGALL